MKIKMKRYLDIDFKSTLLIEKRYIQKEKAVIPIEVRESDLYVQYDTFHRILAPELISYIEQIAYYIPYQYGIVLNFYKSSWKEDEKIELMQAISEWFGLKTHEMKVELHYNFKKCVKLFFVGAFILALSYLVRRLESFTFFSEILSIVGTFSIWEFVNTIWFERKNKKVAKMNSGQLATCTVEFSCYETSFLQSQLGEV